MHEASNRSRRHGGTAVALVETSDPYATVVDCVPLLDAGYDVVLCGGSRADELCPVLDGLPCPLVRQADIVINAVQDPTTQAAVVAGIRRLAPDVTVAVVTSGPTDAIQGCVHYPDVGRAARHLGRPGTRRCAREHQPVVSMLP